MTFKIRYKKSRSWFWTTRTITGFNLIKEQDRFVLFFQDGSIQELAKWSEHDCKLGVDWVLFQKKQMEKESGQPITLAVGT